MALCILKFHPRFFDELEIAIAYYNELSKSTGLRFRSATKKQLGLLKKNPHTRSVRYDDIRFARIEKFPYAIHYSIDLANNRVLVHSLLCDFQNPDMHWQKRM
jgi:hypothetical protein